jgi:hypothetical protein
MVLAGAAHSVGDPITVGDKKNLASRQKQPFALQLQ